MKRLSEIDGYEHLVEYLINEKGQVWSEKTNKYLKTRPDRRGYITTQMWFDNKKQHALVHRLVWAYHFGKVPDGLEINHIDGNRSNNDISNLEVCTSSENSYHAYRIGLSSHAKQVLKIDGNSAVLYSTIKKAAIENNIDPSSITKACKGKVKNAGGFHWQYS